MTDLHQEIQDKILFLIREKGKSKGIYSILEYNRFHITYASYHRLLTVYNDLDIVFQTLENELITFTDGNWIHLINNYYREVYRNAEKNQKALHT